MNNMDAKMANETDTEYEREQNEKALMVLMFLGVHLHARVFLMVVGVTAMVVNALWIWLIVRSRRGLKGKRFVFVFNMAISDFWAGVVLSVVGVALYLGGSAKLLFILHLEVCFSIGLTFSNYTSSMLVQLIAVKRPLYYRTRLTRAKIVLILLAGWTAAGLYTLGKYVFSVSVIDGNHDGARAWFYVDQVVRNLHLILNLVCFAYVFRVAFHRQSHRHPADGAPSSRGGDSFTHPRKSYRAVVTSGCGLAVYLLTFLPLHIYGAYVTITNAKDLNSHFYIQSKSNLLTFLIIWFLRSIADPVLTFIRERRTFRSPRSSFSNTSNTTNGGYNNNGNNGNGNNHNNHHSNNNHHNNNNHNNSNNNNNNHHNGNGHYHAFSPLNQVSSKD